MISPSVLFTLLTKYYLFYGHGPSTCITGLSNTHNNRFVVGLINSKSPLLLCCRNFHCSNNELYVLLFQGCYQHIPTCSNYKVQTMYNLPRGYPLYTVWKAAHIWANANEKVAWTIKKLQIQYEYRTVVVVVVTSLFSSVATPSMRRESTKFEQHN